MMNKIVDVEQAIKISKNLKKRGVSVVLAGGCFDILHIGHVRFLKQAKNHGQCLIVVLESDESMKQRKGEHRPIFTQKDRAEVLSALEYVDYIVVLPYFKSDSDYDNLINAIKPTIIATTKGDPHRHHKKRQAKLTGGKIIDVIERVSKKSTSQVAKLLSKELEL